MRIAVIAPSGPVDVAALEVGKDRLRRRHPDVTFLDAPNISSADGYLAGDDAARTAGVLWAFTEADADVVWFARGGYGATRIVGRLDWPALAATKRPLLGYSDASAFLAAYHAAGGPSFHAPMLAADLARSPSTMGSATERSWESLDRIFFEGGVDRFAFAGTLEGADTVEGIPLAGNIAVLASLAGTRHFPSGRDRVICLEEVHEEPYRVDRSLTQLRVAGLFSGARAVVFGSMTECVPEDTSKSWTNDAMLKEFASRVGLPVVYNFPFGHGGTNTVIPWGGWLRVARGRDAGAGEITGASALVAEVRRSG